jgi:hypothetical protein
MSRQALSLRTSQVGRYSRRLVAGIAVLVPIMLASASAAPPDTGLGAGARLVSDDELGELRGRYIEPESVNFFGIELASSWQTADGVVLTATLQFEANFNQGQPQSEPVVLASFMHGCAACGDPGLEIGGNITADFGAEGLTTVDGAVQSNQISGDDNDVANLLRVRVGDFDADSAGFDDSGDVITQSITHKFADGSAIEFKVEPNAIGVAIQGPTGQGADGLVMQGINGQAANQIAQHVQLMGDANAVYNTLDVVIGVDQLQTTQYAVENAMSVLKGWGF